MARDVDTSDLAIRRDVAYKRAPDGDLTLDVVEPRDARATLVDIHGGGWFRGDKATEEDLAVRLARRGFRVLVPNYRLAPAHPFPAARDDVLDAAAWAGLAATDPLGFIGGSAGGNLAVEAAVTVGRPSVSWSGMIDLSGSIAATEGTEARAPAPGLDPVPSAGVDQGGRDDAFLRWIILENVAGDRSRLDAATPIDRVSAATGPIYMANSVGEFVPPDGARLMAARLAEAGVESVVHIVPGTAHAKGYLDAVLDSSVVFLERTLGL